MNGCLKYLCWVCALSSTQLKIIIGQWHIGPKLSNTHHSPFFQVQNIPSLFFREYPQFLDFHIFLVKYIHKLQSFLPQKFAFVLPPGTFKKISFKFSLSRNSLRIFSDAIHEIRQNLQYCEKFPAIDYISVYSPFPSIPPPKYLQYSTQVWV